MTSFYTLDVDSSNVSNLEITKDLDMKGFAVRKLKTYPTLSNDAASRKYVDDETAKRLAIDGS